MDDRPPGLVVMAPRDYWAGYLENRKASQWWPVLSSLAMEVDDLLGIETQFLVLSNAAFQMGDKHQAPQLTGDCSIIDVAELFVTRG